MSLNNKDVTGIVDPLGQYGTENNTLNVEIRKSMINKMVSLQVGA